MNPAELHSNPRACCSAARQRSLARFRPEWRRFLQPRKGCSDKVKRAARRAPDYSDPTPVLDKERSNVTTPAAADIRITSSLIDDYLQLDDAAIGDGVAGRFVSVQDPASPGVAHLITVGP